MKIILDDSTRVTDNLYMVGDGAGREGRTTMSKQTRNARILKNDVFCTTIEPNSGRELEDGTLEAGALVLFDERDHDMWREIGQPVTFLASTDRGRTWYQHKTFAALRV